MLNLQKRIKGIDEDADYLKRRVNIRDKLLAQEVKDLEAQMKELPHCQLKFVNEKSYAEMLLTICPMSGMYRGGKFKFRITVPPEYNDMPPVVKCLTRIWHPNISEDGPICLSLLRQSSLDGFGWMPTRRLTDVILGLNSLFTDLIDFDDPLNVEAANQFSSNKDAFQHKVSDYIRRFCN